MWLFNTSFFVTTKKEMDANEKSELLKKLQRWNQIDQQLKIVTEKLRDAQQERRELAQQIHETISEKKLDIRKISLSDGELRLGEKREYSPLSFSYVETCLMELLHDSEKVQHVIEYLRENRQVKIVPDIRKITF